MKKNEKRTKYILKVCFTLIGLFVALKGFMKLQIRINKKNELQNNITNEENNLKMYITTTIYEKVIKVVLDQLVSFLAIIVLLPLFVVISLAIYIDDPGPIIFSQKRVGKNKSYFNIYKFRSMKMSTPHNVPTHMLTNPDQYITKVGKFLRKYSLDELPQLFNIFESNMSFVGPRPALWNQFDLIEERDKYGANSIKPGLTGWAQINGRDELELEVKARLDGEYVTKIKENSLTGLIMDMKCFLGTISSVLTSKGVVEGGTGELNKYINMPDIAPIDENSVIDYSVKKCILIAGEGSYIGEEFKKYMSSWTNYEIDSIDTRDSTWVYKDFSRYDVIYDVAGIAHIKETEHNKKLYFDVNRDLAIDLAKKAKKEGVKHFIYLSSMSVYGMIEGHIDKETTVSPTNSYGKSKLEAEIKLWEMNDANFIVSIVRPPMVYGKGCKGNYQMLRKFALKFSLFPNYDNERSMIYIDNLSSVVRNIIHYAKSGIYFPQNLDYINTKNIVKMISLTNEKKLQLISGTKIFIIFGMKYLNIFKKVFGDLTYDQNMNVPHSWIKEKDTNKTFILTEADGKTSTDRHNKKRVLVLMSTYNGEKYVEEQILSIINQDTDCELKIRIRDDGSTDGTCTIIKDMMSKYPNKLELIEGKNLGYNGSFFELLYNASDADYYAISDQDDVWFSDKINTALNFLGKRDNNKPLLYASTSYLVGDDMMPFGTTRKKLREFNMYNTIVQNICPGHTQVFNNSLLLLLKEKKVNPLDVYVYDSWITNVAMLCGEILFDNQPHTYYRQHIGNQLGSGKGSIGQLISSIKRTNSGDGLKYRKQITSFAEKYEEELINKGYYDEISDFIDAKNFAQKVKYVIKGKLHRQKWQETFAFYVAILIGKY